MTRLLVTKATTFRVQQQLLLVVVVLGLSSILWRQDATSETPSPPVVSVVQAWMVPTPLPLTTNTIVPRRTTDRTCALSQMTTSSTTGTTTGSGARSFRSRISAVSTTPSYDGSGGSTSATTTTTAVGNNGSHSSTVGGSSGSSNSNNVGRILEGGQVIDFSSVKASSTAEMALAAARQKIVLLQEQQQQQVHVTTTPLSSLSNRYHPDHHHHHSQPSTYHFADIRGEGEHQTTINGGEGRDDTIPSILGINQDVIQQVGHDLGTFCSVQEVQECAAYLRSLAPPGLLLSDVAVDTTTTHTSSFVPQYLPSDIARYEAIIAQAYTEAGEVTSAFAKTFYMGTMLMSENARRAIWAVYVWCRRTDEIVDAPRDSSSNGNDEMLLDLSLWEMRLEQLWQTGVVVDVYDLCLLHTRIQYPTMDIQPFMDMIRGMLMDVPDLGIERYETFDELHLYCYRVAGTVGVMSLPVFGCASGYNEDLAREPALSLGVAFQLTNILRDVGEDAKDRGRIYLPRDDMIQFGVSEDQIFAQHVDDNYRSMMKYQIARARMYYERARRGVFMLAEESRLPVQTSLDAYGRILDKIEENNYDSLTKRAYVDKWEKLSIIPFSWYRTTDVSRTFPLPGDKPVDLTLA